MSKNINSEENRKAAFNWKSISGTSKNRHLKKPAWEEKLKNLSGDSSSSASSDHEGDVRVSARQRKLLSSSQDISRGIDVGRFSNFSGSAASDRDWLKSARQRELIRTGSGSNLKGLEREHTKSALKKEWPSLACQRQQPDSGPNKPTAKWTGSAGSSREFVPTETFRDSAGSLRKSGSGADLLVNAVRFGRLRHVKLLLEGGTDPNSLDHEGVSPLVAGIADLKDERLQKKILYMLLEAGADPNIGDCDGTTPLMHAAVCNCHDAAVILLQESKTDPSIKNDAGFSALMYAACKGYSNIVLLILAAFKKIHHVTHLGEKNCNGLTAIDLAEENGHYDIAALLRVDLIPFTAARQAEKNKSVPGVHLLSRSPTPSDDSLVLSEGSDSLDLNQVNDHTFRPPSPVSDCDEIASLSLVQKVGFPDNATNFEASSSLGSGNEADTESLMDEDGESTNEETEASTKMSTSALGSSPPIITTSDSLNSSPRHKTRKQAMKIVADLGTIEKIKDNVPGIFHRVSEQNVPITSQVHSLNPLKKVSIPTHNSFTVGEPMPRIELAGSVRSLNKSIKSLIQEDQELKPSIRPPTPARPSLPVLAGRQDSDSDSPLSTSSSSEVAPRSRRITLAAFSRSPSEGQTLITSPQRALQNDDEVHHDILDASTKSEGWDAVWGSKGRLSIANSDGHVVPLPPIGQTRYVSDVMKLKRAGKQGDQSVLSVAKKTLEKLDNVLGADDTSMRKNKSHSKMRSMQHLNLSS